MSAPLRLRRARRRSTACRAIVEVFSQVVYSGPARGNDAQRGESAMGNRLYVGILPYDIDEVGLRAFFGDGVDGHQVTQVKIITDGDTGRPRGFAFAEVGSADQAKDAISRLNGQELGGRTIVVNEAREP